MPLQRSIFKHFILKYQDKNIKFNIYIVDFVFFSALSCDFIKPFLKVIINNKYAHRRNKNSDILNIRKNRLIILIKSTEY